MAIEQLNNWYKKFIQPKIQILVYELRNHGINTTCSCQHERYVQCDNLQDEDVTTIRHILFQLGYDSVGFKIIRQQTCNKNQNTDRLYITWNEQYIPQKHTQLIYKQQYDG